MGVSSPGHQSPLNTGASTLDHYKMLPCEFTSLFISPSCRHREGWEGISVGLSCKWRVVGVVIRIYSCPSPTTGFMWKGPVCPPFTIYYRLLILLHGTCYGRTDILYNIFQEKRLSLLWQKHLFISTILMQLAVTSGTSSVIYLTSIFTLCLRL